MNRAARLVAMNVSLSLLNIVIFSKAFLGLEIFGQSAMVTAFGVMWVFLTIAVFLYGNYKILYAISPPPAKIADRRFETLESCGILLTEYISREGKAFDSSLQSIKNQLERMLKKERTITDILLQKFQATELSFNKFQGQIEAVKKILRLNTRSVLNRLYAFDESEYEKPFHSSGRHFEAKRALLNEYHDFLNQTIDYNEDILLKMDRLILELSKLNDPEELNNMDAFQEIDTLINNTKWYK
ncbi:MAG: hypothetical protein LBB94_10700 [Clostridiales bacterium]|jgi:hypothetical protein|nr:hypothetical protein [Clostridiales bacterium]